MASRGDSESQVLTVVAPAYNEAAGIDRFVRAFLAEADAVGRVGLDGIDRLELVVVDDGSVDGTDRAVLRVAGRDDRVRIVRHPENRGLGAAIRTGIDAATGELVLYTDADLPVDLRELGPALALYRSSGSVMVAGRRHRIDGPWSRRLMTVGYNGLVRVLLGLPVHDVNFAFKLFDRAVVAGLDLHSEGSFIDAELVAKVHRSGQRWTQIGLEYQERQAGSSSLANARAVRRLLLEMARSLPEIRSGGSHPTRCGAHGEPVVALTDEAAPPVPR